MKIILLSGGLDSACLTYYLLAYNLDSKILCIFIDYGQKNVDAEYTAAAKLCAKLNLPLKLIKAREIFEGVKCSILATSNEAHTVTSDELPNRNATLISIAASYIPSDKYATIYVAAHKTSAPYADATRRFYTLMNKLIAYSTNNRISVEAPFIGMSKTALVKKAIKAGMTRQDMEDTVSCYEGTGCGRCPACKQRKLVLDRINI